MSIFTHFRSILGAREEKAPEPTAVTPQKIAAAWADRRQRKRVNAREGTLALIIDDSPTIVAALRKILRSAKYEVMEAGDAEAGLELAKARRPGLIFLDIVLPGMSGFAALRLMRRDATLAAVPIIMISGNEQATEQFYANRIGADDFMKKPFSRYEVFARIEALLGQDRVPARRNLAARI